MEYDIKLKDNAKPYHGKAFPVPKAYEQALRTEVERLCKIGVLKKINRSEWAAPTFIIPKKDQTVRFISDFICKAALSTLHFSSNLERYLYATSCLEISNS